MDKAAQAALSGFKEGVDFQVTKWSGLDNFECLKCQFAHLDPIKLELHLTRNLHLWSFPGKTQDLTGSGSVAHEQAQSEEV